MASHGVAPVFGKGRERGVALVITLAIISVLLAAVLESGRQSRDALLITMAQTNGLKAEQMALSGVHLAMFILAGDAEQSDIDSIQEAWADPDMLARAVTLLGFESGSLTLDIDDEMGKIQINSLIDGYPGHEFNNDQRRLWERLLFLFISGDKSTDIRDPSEIINALKDWLDSGDDDEETGISGAEQPYYQRLNPPVTCSNGKMDTLDEIFMIKGVSRDLLASGKDLFRDVELATIFTTYGMDEEKNKEGQFRYPGTININTADMIVLAAMLPTGMEDQATELVKFRAQRPQGEINYTNALESGWYREILDLTTEENRNFERIIRYSSYVFTIRATARLNGISREMSAVVKREKNEAGIWGCKMLHLSGHGL